MKVAVLDVPPVAAQVNCDSMGARKLANDRSRDRVGLDVAPGLPHGGNVIDIYSKMYHVMPSRIEFEVLTD
jgi:hypothetical protein